MTIRREIWVLGLHAFSFILLLIFIDLLIGCFISYEYVFLADRQAPQITKPVLKFDDKAYKRVLEEIDNNQKILPPPAPDKR